MEAGGVSYGRGPLGQWYWEPSAEDLEIIKAESDSDARRWREFVGRFERG